MNIAPPLATLKLVGLAMCCLSVTYQTVNAQCSLTPSEQRHMTKVGVYAYEAVIDKHYRRGIRLSRTELRLARKACDKHREFDAMGQLANGYFGLRRYHTALSYYQ